MNGQQIEFIVIGELQQRGETHIHVFFRFISDDHPPT